MDSSLIEGTYDTIKEKMAFIPENYRSCGAVKVGTALTIDPQQIFGQIKKYQPAPLWRLYTKSKRFYTSKPISVRIYREDDLFFAENENLVVCGTGDTADESLQDLCLHIIHFFEYYKRIDKSKLTGDALRLKELYKNLLIEE